jgi:hypothetical protein
MILRILAQESPDSELRLKRYGVLKLRGLYMNLEGSMGFFRKLPGALVNRICNLERVEGFMCKIGGLAADL